MQTHKVREDAVAPNTEKLGVSFAYVILEFVYFVSRTISMHSIVAKVA